ncbi:MAG: cytosolic protein, partial [Magnetococcales bacterium]|nr:cytosolic protein [Magnetococcales bacterium]
MRFYFKEFISFFLPVAYEEIDWQRPPEFLDKELDRITKEAKGKNRRVDLLV